MPTYWKDRNLIHFAASKRHIGLYPGPEAVAAFAEQLKDYKTSKGTIQLPCNKPLPKVLTGIRRGGKSVLLEQIRDEINSPIPSF